MIFLLIEHHIHFLSDAILHIAFRILTINQLGLDSQRY